MEKRPEMDNFQKLKTSILLAVFRQEALHPEMLAVEGLTKEGVRLNKVSEYISEIERVMKELKLALSLIEEIPPDDFLAKHGSLPEDYILYHQGNVLNLIHQLKDKIGHACDGLTSSEDYKEREKMKPLKLAEEEKIQQVPGLSEELKKWDQDSESGIGVALRKRTNYQHFRNKLGLHPELQKVKTFRTFQQPQSQANLSEYGKKSIAEMGKKSFEVWHQEVAEKVKASMQLAEEHVQNISKVLYDCPTLNLPRVEEVGPIYAAWEKVLEALKIENSADRKKVSATYEPLVANVEDMFPKIFGDQLVSVYLVGSIPRGEAIFPTSDVNLVSVVEDQKVVEGVQQTLQEFSEKMEMLGLYMDFGFISRSEFLSEPKKKLRFICKTDGVLIGGEDAIPKDEKFPKPGLALAALLNSDLKGMLQAAYKRVTEQESLPLHELKRLTLTVARAYLRLMFSAVMTESAVYERNLTKMREMVEKRYPENKELSDTIYKLATGESFTDQESLKNLIEGGLEEGRTFSNILKKISEENDKLPLRKKYR